MEIPEEPGAILVSALVIVIFLFLRSLTIGRLPEYRQTAAWVVFTILFFCICSVFFRAGAEAGVVSERSLVETTQAGLTQ
jgi:hypothetical protein